MIHLICVAILVLLTGCVTTTEYKFPSDIKSACDASKHNAKTCINSKGGNLKEKAKELKVTKVPGEKKFASGWGWRSPEWNGMWVLGLTYTKGGGKYEIKIGCNPKTQQDISMPALIHEFGHYWLISSHNDHSHNGKYSECFWNWNDPNVRSMHTDEVQYMNVEKADGTSVIVHYIPDLQKR